MKVLSDEKELGGVKSVNENYFEKFISKLPKANPSQTNLCEMFREKQNI